MSGTRVFIGRLTYKARESDVERFFKGFGRIRDISLKNGYGFVEFEDSRDADDAVYELNNRDILGERVTIEHARGVPRSGGMRGGGGRGDYGGRDRYESRGGSDRYSVSGGGRSGSDRGGGRGGGSEDRNGRVNYYESRAIGKYGPPVRTKYRVIVENLSTRVSWQDLKDYLREAGEVTYADAHKHRQNEGVVDFSSFDDMKRAIEKMDNTEINGRRIRLIEDTSHRSTSRSRSRSRSPRRSRSRSPRRSVSRSRSPRSRSRSDRNRSPVGRRSRSPSGGRRSRSASGGRRSRSASGGRRSRSASGGRRSRSASGGRRSRSASGGRRSRSASGGRRSRSASGGRRSGSPSGSRRSRSPSGGRRSRSPSGDRRSRSATPRKDSNNGHENGRSRSRSPVSERQRSPTKDDDKSEM